MHGVPAVVTQLLSSFHEGAREEAWRGFLQEYSRLLLHVARSMSPRHDAAMDVYTHLLGTLRADDFSRIRTFVADGRSKFSTWLVVVARRSAVDFQRQRFGRRRDGESDAVRAEHEFRKRLTELAGDDVELESVADTTSPADDALVARETRQCLSRALDTLSAADRLILKLRFEDGLSASEISQTVGLATPFHVYRRLDSIIATLRRTLVARGIESSVR